MAHTSRPPGQPANVLGALALAVCDRMERATAEASGLHGSAPAALTALHTFLGGATIELLSRVLGLSHSASVRVVDRLVSAGLARRRAGEGDARSVAVVLTPAGRRRAERALAAREAALEGVMDQLGDADRERLARLAGALLGPLTGGRSDAGHICRLCDPHACGHPEGHCPVTRAADAAEAA